MGSLQFLLDNNVILSHPNVYRQLIEPCPTWGCHVGEARDGDGAVDAPYVDLAALVHPKGAEVVSHGGQPRGQRASVYGLVRLLRVDEPADTINQFNQSLVYSYKRVQ